MMKYIFLMLVCLLASCSSSLKNGILQTEDGWTIVLDGTEYNYEVDEYCLYLFLEDKAEQPYYFSYSFDDEPAPTGTKQYNHTKEFHYTQKCANGTYAYAIPLRELGGRDRTLSAICLNGINYDLSTSANMEVFAMLMEYVRRS